MNDTEYIGMRYVPVFADPAQWDISRQYENLMMVTNEGETYISKQFVPTGIKLDNTEYWVQISVPDGSTSGGVNYSTEEQDTGLKWIDGRTIYQKTFVFENSSDNLTQDFTFTSPSLINCMLIRGWNTWHNQDNYCVTNTVVQYGLDSTTGGVHMMFGPQVAYGLSDGKQGSITLQYIKLNETPVN